MFSNTVKVEWIEGEPRNMRLLEDVIYTDPSMKEWLAPAGSIVDGASIPKILWGVSGSPFVGRYRRASVLHDVYCTTKSEPCEKVHKMFFEAMLADLVDLERAQDMYFAVKTFGPRW